MKARPGRTVVVVDPLTASGRRLREVLRERRFPIATLRLVAAGGDGLLTEDDGEAAYVAPLGDDSFSGADLAFFCGRVGPDDVAWPTRLPAIGLEGAGESSSWQLSVPKQVPHRNRIPGASAWLAARVLEPLGDALKRASGVLLEPASVAASGALDELLGQVTALLTFEPLPKEVLGRQRAFNVFPSPPGNAAEQARQALGLDIPIALTTLSGASFHGHALAVHVELEGLTSAAAVAKRFRRGRDFELVEAPPWPGPVEAAGTDPISIGPIQADGITAGGFWIWAVCDHQTAGPARLAVELAEKLLA